jgi:hypothetical protein
MLIDRYEKRQSEFINLIYLLTDCSKFGSITRVIPTMQHDIFICRGVEMFGRSLDTETMLALSLSLVIDGGRAATDRRRSQNHHSGWFRFNWD